MRHVLSGVDTTSEWSGKVIGMLVLAMTGILLWEITLRYVFRAPTVWAHETCQHLFGSYSVLAGAYALLRFQHVKVDVLYARLSPRVRAIADSVTYLVFFLFVGVMLVYGVQMAWHSVEVMETSHTTWRPPVYPLKLTIPIGAFLLLLQGLANFIRVLSMAITGKELA